MCLNLRANRIDRVKSGEKAKAAETEIAQLTEKTKHTTVLPDGTIFTGFARTGSATLLNDVFLQMMRAGDAGDYKQALALAKITVSKLEETQRILLSEPRTYLDDTGQSPEMHADIYRRAATFACADRDLPLALKWARASVRSSPSGRNKGVLFLVLMQFPKDSPEAIEGELLRVVNSNDAEFAHVLRNARPIPADSVGN